MCGIFGHIGTNYDKNKFKVLGLYNDARGGDSCGVFHHGKLKTDVAYGADKNKKFKDFVENGLFIDAKIGKPTIALGHCRKASVGAIGLQQAQPVVIYENDKPVFAMIHNGTLINYEELANTYDVAYSNHETDSQIFCKIVYKAGFKVLSEYEGAGAFVFWDSRVDLNTVFIFKGASLFYKNDDKLYEERPLYFINHKNSFWFSSMENSLEFIMDDNDTIVDMECNTLYKIKNGNIESTIEIDRSKRKQTKQLSYKSTVGQRYLPFGSYEDYDDYDYGGYYNSKHSTNQPTEKEFVNKIRAQKLFVNKKMGISSDGYYYINNKKANGEYKLSNSGYEINSETYGSTYYFIDGVMIKSYFDYLCANAYISALEQESDDDFIDVFLAPFAVHPVPFEISANDYQMYHFDTSTKSILPFCGVFQVYFTLDKEIYKCNSNGEITEFNKFKTAGIPSYEQTKDSLLLDSRIRMGMISDEMLEEMIADEIVRFL